VLGPGVLLLVEFLLDRSRAVQCCRWIFRPPPFPKFLLVVESRVSNAPPCSVFRSFSPVDLHAPSPFSPSDPLVPIRRLYANVTARVLGSHLLFGFDVGRPA